MTPLKRCCCLFPLFAPRIVAAQPKLHLRLPAPYLFVDTKYYAQPRPCWCPSVDEGVDALPRIATRTLGSANLPHHWSFLSAHLASLCLEPGLSSTTPSKRTAPHTRAQHHHQTPAETANAPRPLIPVRRRLDERISPRQNLKSQPRLHSPIVKHHCQSYHWPFILRRSTHDSHLVAPFSYSRVRGDVAI